MVQAKENHSTAPPCGHGWVLQERAHNSYLKPEILKYNVYCCLYYLVLQSLLSWYNESTSIRSFFLKLILRLVLKYSRCRRCWVFRDWKTNFRSRPSTREEGRKAGGKTVAKRGRHREGHSSSSTTRVNKCVRVSVWARGRSGKDKESTPAHTDDQRATMPMNRWLPNNPSTVRPPVRKSAS